MKENSQKMYLYYKGLIGLFWPWTDLGKEFFEENKKDFSSLEFEVHQINDLLNTITVSLNLFQRIPLTLLRVIKTMHKHVILDTEKWQKHSMGQYGTGAFGKYLSLSL